MSKKSLVSVIIPVYNHENYVEETIKSLINQTYQNIELIIIDDGSKDSSAQKVENLRTECEKRFQRFYFEIQENKGTCETINKLILLTKGEYIYIIASDDLAKPKAIEKEVAFLEQNPDYVLCVSDNEIIDSKSHPIGWDEYQNAIPLSRAQYKTFGTFLQHNTPQIDFHSSKFGTYETLVPHNYIPNGYLVRTDAIKKMGGFKKEAPLEDWYMHLQLSKIGKYKYLNEILFSYRWHNSNTIKNHQKMVRMSLQTQQYEFAMISSMTDYKWKNIFLFQIEKIKLNLFFFKIIRRRWISKKEKFIEFFGKRYTL